MAWNDGRERLTVLADHFDIDAMDTLKEVMEDEFPELIQVYIDDSNKRMPLFYDALNNNDAGAIRELAHSFKGASSNISATPLAGVCYELELAGKNADLSDAADILGRIEQEYDQVRRLLSEML